MTGKYPLELKQAPGNMYRIYLLTYLFYVLSVAFSTLRKNPWGNKEAGQTQFRAIQKNRKLS